MNKLLKQIIILFIGIMLLFPVSVQARNLQDLNGVKLSDNINEDCGLSFEIEGCYKSDSRIIYISTATKQMSLIFYHEIGHFLFDGTSEEEYNKVFNPFYSSFSTPFIVPMKVIQEIATWNFTIWVIDHSSPSITDVMRAFFNKKLID